jgi:antitoxin (DNA-binding transcriptional repressor) of toxin-antitoxin stability system
MHELSIETTSKIPLQKLIESVVQGDEIVFTENDHPVAKLIAVQKEKPSPKFGSAKGLFTLADDFDEPLEDFDEYR